MAFPTTPFVHVEAAFGALVKAFSPAQATWTDLSDRLRSGRISRGRTSDLDALAAGTATLVLDNRDDELTPGNTQSSYWPDVHPSTPIRVVANDHAFEILYRAPTHYWPLHDKDEPFTDWGTGTPAAGTFNSTPTPRAGGLGDFPGTESVVDFPGTSGYRVDTSARSLLGSAFSAMCVFQLGSATPLADQGVPFACTRGAATSADFAWYFRVTTGGVVQFLAWNTGGSSTTVQSSSTFDQGETVVAVATWDGSNLRLYVNGTLEGGPTAFSTPNTTTVPTISVAAHGNNSFPFDGLVGHCATWEGTTLSATQVDQITFTLLADADHTHYLFYGTIEQIVPYQPEQGTDSLVEVECVDMFQQLLNWEGGLYAPLVSDDGADHHWRYDTDSDPSSDRYYDEVTGEPYLTPTVNNSNPPTAAGSAPLYDTSDAIHCRASSSPSSYEGVELDGMFSTTTSMSVEFWYRIDGQTTDDCVLVQQGLFDSNYDWVVYIKDTTNTIAAAVGNTTTGELTYTDAVVVDNEWHHVVLTFDGSSAWEMYFDGASVDTKTDAHTLTYSAGSVGYTATGAPQPEFDIAELALYSLELSATDVDNHWQAAAGWPNLEPGELIGKVLDVLSVPGADRTIATGAADAPDMGRLLCGAGITSAGSLGGMIDDIVTPIFGNFAVLPNGKWTYTHPLERPSTPEAHYQLFAAAQYWPMSGSVPASTVLDESFRRQNGTKGGNPAADTGNGFDGLPLHGSWVFDGVNDSVDGDELGFDIGTDWTMSGWFFPTGTGQLFGLYTTGGTVLISFYYDNSVNKWYYNTPSDGTTELTGQSTTSPASNWYHFVVVRLNTNTTIWYLNGTEMGSWSPTIAATGSTNKFHVGEDPGGTNDYDGQMHSIALMTPAATSASNAGWVETLYKLSQVAHGITVSNIPYRDVAIVDDDSRYFNVFRSDGFTFKAHGLELNWYGERVYEISSGVYDQAVGESKVNTSRRLAPAVGKLRGRGPRVESVLFDAASTATATSRILDIELNERVAVTVPAYAAGDSVKYAGYVDQIEDSFEPARFERRIALSP